MTILTQDQIVQVARAGGLPGDPEVWSAIAMAESSGDPTVVNEIGCVGLWQINQKAHVKAHPTWTVAWLQNPVNNAKAASVIYRAQGFDAWEGYTGPSGHGSSGNWRNFYRKSKAVQVFDWNDPFGLWPKGWGKAPGSKGGDTLNDWTDGSGSTSQSLDPGIGDVATGVGTIAEAVKKTAVWLGNSKHWVQIGYVVGGGVLVLLGLTIVARPLLNATPTGRAVTTAAKALKPAKKSPKKPAKKEEEGGDDDDE